MLSEASARYLMKIYEMVQNSKKITPQNLAKEMGVKRPTAFEFIKKLEKEKYLKEENREYFLTERGVEEAKRIIRNHRIMETLLYRAGVELSRACDIASKMQYMMDERSVDCICEYLGNPKFCPHGRPIPEVVSDGGN